MARAIDLRFIITDTVAEKKQGMDLVQCVKEHFDDAFEDLLTSYTEVDDKWVEDNLPSGYYKKQLPVTFTPDEVSIMSSTLSRALYSSHDSSMFFEKKEIELLDTVIDKLEEAWKLHRRACNG